MQTWTCCVQIVAHLSVIAESLGMCGTAAVVVKVNSINHGDKTMTFDDFEAGMH